MELFMLCSSILDTIGNTPTVPLKKIGSSLSCELFGKCEFFNPCGSTKDRIALRMIEKAEEEKIIKPGDTLIEPTSGNTGLGLALVAARKGYKLIITMPEKMSLEKEIILKALGATIVRTPTEAGYDDPESLFGVAKKLQSEIPNSHILDQYTNCNNPDAHYYGTGEEIIEDMGENLKMVVIGVGTGGTVTGVARRLKEHYKDIQIVGVDPHGSILGGGDEVCSYAVEGIGYDFFPDVLDNNLIDEYVKISDKDSFLMAQRLIKEEGLLVGGSSGSAVWAALHVAARLKVGERCLVILPDGVRNYMSKFVHEKWMLENNFIEETEEAKAS
jgi:cysteine synthase